MALEFSGAGRLNGSRTGLLISDIMISAKLR